MSQPIKILFNAIDSEASGCQRVISPLKELERLGLAEIQVLNQQDARKQMRWADLLVVQCLIGLQSLDFIKKFREANIPIVIDYDDNFADLPENILKRLKLTKEGAKKNWLEYIMLADIITCPTPYLAETIRRQNWFKTDVRILPNYLLDSEYAPAKNYQPQKNGEIRILYSCSDSHVKDFNWISSLLTYLGESYPQVKLISHGTLDWTYLCPTYSGKASHASYTPYNVYHDSLRQISPHICVAPLLDEEYAKCRSDIKYLQTASVKAAFVGSYLPPYLNTVKHGKTGFLAKTRLGWWWYLRKLIKNPALISEMGQAAYEHAGKFLLKNHIHRWYEVYQELVDRKKR